MGGKTKEMKVSNLPKNSHKEILQTWVQNTGTEGDFQQKVLRNIKNQSEIMNTIIIF